MVFGTALWVHVLVCKIVGCLFCGLCFIMFRLVTEPGLGFVGVGCCVWSGLFHACAVI